MKLIYVVQIIAAAWVLYDGRKRRDRYWLLWALGSLVAPIIFVPLYWGRRPLLEGERRGGGLGYNFCRHFVFIWSVWMAAIIAHSLYGFTEGSGYLVAQGVSESAVLAAGLRLMFLFFMVWLVPFAAALTVGQILKKPEAIETGPTGAAP